MKLLKIISILVLLGFVLPLTLGPGSAARAEPGDKGMRFVMTMHAGDRAPVEFDGTALGTDCRLVSVVGGIETITLLTGVKLYSLTPSIMTASEVDNPNPPGSGEPGWEEWLIEPGRINPITFYEKAGVEGDFSGEKAIGEGGAVKLVFDDGILLSVEFSAGRDNSRIVYNYEGFRQDGSLKPEDFAIPDGYRVLD